ncbi:MAG: hypothetical protein Q8P62_03790 [Candidatus Peregrinibacteria bacterium]|nr:hypothetical protein [Candidatus Peregrinibacteria bacterium]
MKKLLPIFLILSVFVAGCNFSNSNKSLSEKGDAVLDQQFYEQATQSNDLALCNKIFDKDMKSECASIVDAAKLTRKAVSELNIELCKAITIDRYKTACETQVQPLIDAKKADENTAKVGQQAYDQQNAKLCDEIKDEDQKASCKYNILANQAIAKKDPSICEGIGLKAMIEQCKNQLSKMGTK